MNRKYLLLSIDLFWVALSPYAALLIRDNFTPRAGSLSAAVTYASLGLMIAVAVIPLAGLNRTLWRYTSLSDLLRLVMAVTLIVLVALFTTFAISRLEDISRSLPVIQWFFLVAAMAGARIAIRIWQERPGKPSRLAGGSETQHVLIIGISRICELYIRSIEEFVPGRVSIVGILAPGIQLQNRLLRSHKVLGLPEDLLQVVRQMEVHGAPIDRVVVVEPFERLSTRAREALLALERSSTVRVDWITELLGLDFPKAQKTASSPVQLDASTGSDSVKHKIETGPIGSYRHIKRVIDVLAAATLILILAPLGALIAVLTAINLGNPVVFWQKRPGRYGHPFKLHKFRTMHAAHDEKGNIIPDQQRSSKLGEWLRRSRLDELPQLYNILVGQMSFVGPRPLLARDHIPDGRGCFGVRPGLTGWAQVNGGRELSGEDKAALDMCYVHNMSLALDIRIVLRTFALLVTGERVNRDAVLEARQSLVYPEGQSADVISESRLPFPEGVRVASPVITNQNRFSP